MRNSSHIVVFLLSIFLSSGVRSQDSISLTGQLSLPISFSGQTWQLITDVWVYVDPHTGQEYVLVGRDGPDKDLGDALFVINVSNPGNPSLVSTVSGPGTDIKVWKQFVYSVTGFPNLTGQNEGRILDMSNPANPSTTGSFPSAHNSFIDDRGFLYLAGPGLRIMDLNENPRQPNQVWSNPQPEGHDITVIGNRLFEFQGNGRTDIYDITNPASPQLLGAINDPSIRFHHSGWTTEDGNYLFICDEASQNEVPDVTIWDISDVGNPERVGEIDDPEATIHNIYIIDDFAYASYYTAGFRVYNVSDPEKPQLVDRFNTSTRFGAFGVYPFSTGGHIFVSDRDNGLFIFSFSGRVTHVENPAEIPIGFTLNQNYPNPFNPETIIRFNLPTENYVRLRILNTLGQEIRILANSLHQAGSYSVVWDGKDSYGNRVSSGVYIYQMEAGRFSEVKKMMLLR